eukprot:498228_1
MAKHRDTPPLAILHFALVVVQIACGGGAIIAKIGLPSTNPVLFGLIREGISGPILMFIAYAKHKEFPPIKELSSFILPGIFMFLNQFCFIVGIKMSSSIIASAWQPAQGILAVIYGLCFGTEQYIDRYKISGILISLSGAIFMILFQNKNDSGNNDFWSTFGGSILFYLNTSGSALYLIFSKPILSKYPLTIITGLSYMVASICMLIAALIVSNIPMLLNAVCSDCNGKAWNVPVVTMYALIYWILVESVGQYACVTWCNQYTSPSIVSVYTVLQPVVSVIIAQILIMAGYSKCNPHKTTSQNPSDCIYGPYWNDMGAIPIAIGLCCVIYSSVLEKQKEETEDKTADLLSNQQIN